jgi:hypothetical protein
MAKTSQRPFKTSMQRWRPCLVSAAACGAHTAGVQLLNTLATQLQHMQAIMLTPAPPPTLLFPHATSSPSNASSHPPTMCDYTPAPTQPHAITPLAPHPHKSFQARTSPPRLGSYLGVPLHTRAWPSGRRR